MKKYIPLFIVLAMCFGIILSINLKTYYSKKDEVRFLPILGNKIANGLDTTYHTIGNFSFINQLGDTITEMNIKNKDFVVEYFFTTCQSICPIMNMNMMKVAKAFENDTTFKILSHTVNPKTDTVASLLVYAKQHNANPKNWWFLTGTKKALYSMARQNYLMNNEEGDGSASDFIHTQLFVLVDKQKRIRGSYNGTDSWDIDNLIKDIKLLKQEEEQNLVKKE